MKYASLIIFAAALIWTWSIVHNNSPISFETHSGIQERLAEFIVNTVKSKRPNASDIVVEKIWTEVLSEGKVKAFFIYTFKDATGESGLVTSQIRGEGILERKGDDGAGNDQWSLTNVQTTGDAVQFDEATIVTGSPDGSPTEEVPAATESAPADGSVAPGATPTSTPSTSAAPATPATEVKKEDKK